MNIKVTKVPLDWFEDVTLPEKPVNMFDAFEMIHDAKKKNKSNKKIDFATIDSDNHLIITDEEIFMIKRIRE